MSISKSWDIHGLLIHIASMSGSVSMGQVAEYPLSSGVQVGGSPNSGAVFPNCLWMQEARPSAQLVCEDLPTALGNFGILGFEVTSDGSHPGVVMYAQQHLFGSTRKSGSVHKSFAIKSGCIYPVRLVADANMAQMTYEMIAVMKDGTTTDPITVTNNVSLPSLSATESHHRLGTTTVSSAVLKGLERVTVDFNYTLRTKKDGADFFPSWSSIQTGQPTITFDGIDVDWWNNSGAFSLNGVSGSHANTRIQLRKIQCAGRFVGDATPEHIVITANGLIYPVKTLEGSEAGTSLQMACSFDGTTSPVAIALAQTYSP